MNGGGYSTSAGTALGVLSEGGSFVQKQERNSLGNDDTGKANANQSRAKMLDRRNLVLRKTPVPPENPPLIM